MEMRLQEFARKVKEAHLARIRREYPSLSSRPEFMAAETVKVKPGSKYTKVDVGSSGRFMVVNATGEIYGIKAYGVIHRGHFYGTLDNVKPIAFESNRQFDA